MFQQPNPYFKRPTDYWYKAQPVGEGTRGKFLATILENAGLSYIYTNHCIRGKTVTGMRKNGHSLQEIANVVKHKNLESLKWYLEVPDQKDKKNYCKSLSKYAGTKDPVVQNNDDSDLSDFDITPLPKENQRKRQNLLLLYLNHQKIMTKQLSPLYKMTHLTSMTTKCQKILKTLCKCTNKILLLCSYEHSFQTVLQI